MTGPTEPTGRDPDILTTRELAAKLGLSEQTVRRMANAGQIPALQTGKDWRYSWAAVLDVLRQPHPRGGTDYQPSDAGQQRGGTTPRRRGAGRRAHTRIHEQLDGQPQQRSNDTRDL